jgi:choline dehydrogenase-like flavoprotein
VTALTADVVVIGSGIGGATVAHALAHRSADVLVLERGHRVPREPENWSPRAVFLERRYKPAERWLDARGRSFAPGVYYVVGGNTKVYGASLPRFREQDFEAVEHLEGTSLAWPFSYANLEAYYAEAERIYHVHGEAGEDPTGPWRSGPFPYPAVDHEPYVADLAARLRGQGVTPVSNAMGIDLQPGGACVRSPTCDGFPCPRGAKSDAETRGIDPALATGHARLATGVRVRRIVTDGAGGRVRHVAAEAADGPVVVHGARFVLAAGAVNSAALLLASADEKHPRGLANGSDQVGRNFMMHNNAHIVAVDLDRRNDVVFQKTLGVNDWYLDGGDGYPLGSMQLIGKVQGVMMKSVAPRAVPLAVLNQVARRSVEWLVMAEDPRGGQSRHRRRRRADHHRPQSARPQDARPPARARQAPPAIRRLRRHPDPALRHQHEQPPVRDRGRRHRSGDERAGSVVQGARADEPLGRRRQLLPILRGHEPGAHDRRTSASRGRRIRSGRVSTLHRPRTSLGARRRRRHA